MAGNMSWHERCLCRNQKWFRKETRCRLRTVKRQLIFVFVLVCLLSSSKAPAQRIVSNVIQSHFTTYTNPLNFAAVTVVQTPAAKELNEITNKTVNLLLAKDYEKLDQFAAKLRASKETWANGQWKRA